MSALRLRLLTPRALDRTWREDVAHGRITVPCTGEAPALPAEVEAAVELIDSGQVTARFQAQQLLEIPSGGRRLRGTLLNRQDVESAFLSAMSRCPLLGQTVLVATRGRSACLELIPRLAVEGARVTVVHDGRQAFEVLAEGILHMAAAVLESRLEDRGAGDVLKGLVELGGAPDFPIFVLSPDAGTERLPACEAPVQVLDEATPVDELVQRIRASVKESDEGWHFL